MVSHTEKTRPQNVDIIRGIYCRSDNWVTAVNLTFPISKGAPFVT